MSASYKYIFTLFIIRIYILFVYETININYVNTYLDAGDFRIDHEQNGVASIATGKSEFATQLHEWRGKFENG